MSQQAPAVSDEALEQLGPVDTGDRAWRHSYENGGIPLPPGTPVTALCGEPMIARGSYMSADEHGVCPDCLRIWRTRKERTP